MGNSTEIHHLLASPSSKFSFAKNWRLGVRKQSDISSGNHFIPWNFYSFKTSYFAYIPEWKSQSLLRSKPRNSEFGDPRSKLSFLVVGSEVSRTEGRLRGMKFSCPFPLCVAFINQKDNGPWNLTTYFIWYSFPTQWKTNLLYPQRREIP